MRPLKDYQTGLKTPSSQALGRSLLEDAETSGLLEPLNFEPDCRPPCFSRGSNSVP
jgi:hypothetical protein